MSADNASLARDLENAYAELRASDEEVRTQRDAIQQLVESHRVLRLHYERTLSILPVAVVVTDLQGMVRSANAAAALLIGARVGRLRGKPIFSLFESSDRRALRQLLIDTRGGEVVRHAAALQTRDDAVVSVDVTSWVQYPATGVDEISWLLFSGRDVLADGPAAIARALIRLATLSQHADDRDELLQSAAAICQQELNGPAEVSIALGSPLEPLHTATTSKGAQSWDGAQLVAGQGPSDTAFHEGVTTMAASVATDTRWPALAGQHGQEALDDTAVVAAPIRSGEPVLGTMTAYVVEPWSGLEETLELFATALGGVLHELELRGELSRLENDMQAALSSRAVIDQAKGIIMADRGIGPEEAWQHLVHLSSTQHLKVREVAESIVARVTGADRPRPGAG